MALYPNKTLSDDVISQILDDFVGTDKDESDNDAVDPPKKSYNLRQPMHVGYDNSDESVDGYDSDNDKEWVPDSFVAKENVDTANLNDESVIVNEVGAVSLDIASTVRIDEQSTCGTSSLKEFNEACTTETEKKRTRWKIPHPENWKRNISKRHKYNSQPYATKTGNHDAKAPKSVDCSKCRYECSVHFPEEVRSNICKQFWKLGDYKRQKDFILKNVKRGPIQRTRPRNDSNTKRNIQNRKWSKVYYFDKDGTQQRVCKKFFEHTLCLSNGPVNVAFEGINDVGVFAGNDKRGQKRPHNKTKDVDFNFVKDHIQSFPTMESHYCRKNSTRLYLDSKLSISRMYELYKSKCDIENRVPVSLITYRRIFCKEFNLSFFKPKKDLCATCSKYEDTIKKHKSVAFDLKIDYDEHNARRNEANAAKEADKVRSNADSKFLSATVDLQSVLQIPCTDVSPLYYCRKLSVYNLTVYESRLPNEAFCMSWMESNGKRGSSEIGSALLKWLERIPETVEELTIFSDTCSGQNRNQHISAFFLFIVQTMHFKVIEQKYLESGHSHMEVDSMHSAIEKEKKYTPVYSMRDWLNIFHRARSNRKNKTAKPYHAVELLFDDMKDLQDLSRHLIQNRTRDENGDNVRWLNIKCLRYQKDNPGVIMFRYGHSGPYINLQVYSKRKAPPLMPSSLKSLYKTSLPISEEKKKDLVRLCDTGLIPPELRPWYRGLNSNCRIKTKASEPGVEDDDSGEGSE